jgi:glucose-6-phosphate isomerase/transaldolase/glucose-6-phosphate isomerase
MYKNFINLSEEEKNVLLKRFWDKDPGLWTGNNVSEKDILSRLGWIDIARTIKNTIPEITEFADSLKTQGIKKIVLLGMGGSSLAPLMFSRIFRTEEGFPELVILDTTDPEVVENAVSEDELQQVRFIFASKSGSTVEPNVLFSYFWEKISAISGEPGSWFIAITDPGTPLAELAEKNRFLKTFLNSPDIGGRYSALSYFGLVPAALIGADINKLIDNAIKMMDTASASTSWNSNIAGKLIDFLSINLLRSKDKLTIMTDPEIESFALWLEQLIAESSGKETLGFVPIVGESTGIPGYYGGERLFVYLRLKTSSDHGRYNDFIKELRDADFPVYVLELEDIYDIGSQIILWEIATVFSCYAIEVNPFDEPDVMVAKTKTGEILEKFRETGKIPVNLWVDPQSKMMFRPSDLLASSMKGLTRTLRDLFSILPTWGYVGFLAYLPYDDETEEIIGEMRHIVRQEQGCATVMGYGPRYLHSTGQVFKGGPASAGFIIITRKRKKDYPPIKGFDASLWHIQFAQAVGDFEALQSIGRRVVHIHLPADYKLGLKSFSKVLSRAARLMN